MLLALYYSSYVYEIYNVGGTSKKRDRDTRQSYLYYNRMNTRLHCMYLIWCFVFCIFETNITNSHYIQMWTSSFKVDNA